MSTPVWDDGGWERLAPLTGEVEADLCVVGLGGSGLAAVREALALGASVAGLDAASVGGGAAGRNAGFLLAGAAPFHHDLAAAVGRDRAIAIHRATSAEIDRIAGETPEVVRRTGSVRLACSPEEEIDCEAHLAAMRTDRLVAEPYEGRDGRGVLFPGDAGFQPLARCRTLARRTLAAGARLYEASPAVTIAGDEVRTPAGRVRCRRGVVVAVDGGLEQVLPELAGRVRTARAQVLATEPVAALLPRPVYARFGWDYWQQTPEGRVVLGGCRDRGGPGEWTAQAVISVAVQADLDRLLATVLGPHGLRARVTHRWAGAIAFTDDRLPVLEEVRAGVVATGAYSGTGNVVGAICGRAAARRVLDGDWGPGALFASAG